MDAKLHWEFRLHFHGMVIKKVSLKTIQLPQLLKNGYRKIQLKINII